MSNKYYCLSKIFEKKFENKKFDLPDFNQTADANWIINKSGFPYLKLGINVPVTDIFKEINNVKHLLVPHRDSYGEHEGWTSFCIHGKSEDATREDEHYSDSRPHIWTNTALSLMPKTVEYFQEWHRVEFLRLRVMCLAPGGYISIHRDAKLPGNLSPINIAITNPEKCKFYFESGPVPFKEGDAYMLNIANLHTVINESDEYRYHLIVHYRARPTFIDNLVEKSYHSLYAS